MDQVANAAHEHLRRMELRIEHQTALITQLTMSGEDTLEAAKRLVLLRNTLVEMRAQLGALAPAAPPKRRDDPPIFTVAS